VKVLYIAPEYPNRSQNAAQVRSNNLIKHLSFNADVNLQVLSFRADNGGGVNISSDINICVLEKSVSSFKLLVSTFFSIKPRVFTRYNETTALNKINEMVGSFDPDIIHIDSFGLAQYLHNVSTIKGRKVILHIHDSISLLLKSHVKLWNLSLKNIDRYLQYKKVTYFEKNHYSAAACCIVDSDNDKCHLIKINDDNNVKTLPLGYDATLYKMKSIDEHNNNGLPSIVFTGNMSSAQTIDAVSYLINNVMNIVWNKVPDCHLYLVGAQPSEEIKSICNVSNNITITGFVQDILNYLNPLNIYVCPLRTGSGMKTRTIEALASGCAVVSTSAGLEGIDPDIIKNIAVMEDDPGSMAKKIIELLTNETKRNELGVNASAYVKEKYTWDNITSELIELYKDVMHS
jgi:glycosyltransferase involved in cell wall biosynthesis